MELLEEQADQPQMSPGGSGASPGASSPAITLREAQLQQAEQRILQIAGQQQKTALYIQTLLTLLGARSLLLLGLAAATALTWLILINPEASVQKMILVAAADALLVLPLVWLIAKKG